MIYKKNNGNHVLDYTDFNVDDNLLDFEGGPQEWKTNFDKQVKAITEVIEQEGPLGNHVWELTAPPDPDDAPENDNRTMRQFCRALDVLDVAYNTYAEKHPDGHPDDPCALCYTDCTGDSFDSMEFGRWSRIDRETIGIDMKYGHNAIQAGPCDLELSAYDYYNYYYAPDILLITMVVRAMLGRNITPAMASYLSATYEAGDWPLEALYCTEKEFIDQYPAMLDYLKEQDQLDLLTAETAAEIG